MSIAPNMVENVDSVACGLSSAKHPDRPGQKLLMPACSSGEEHLFCWSLTTVPFVRVRTAHDGVRFSFLGRDVKLLAVDFLPRHECGYHSD